MRRADAALKALIVHIVRLSFGRHHQEESMPPAVITVKSAGFEPFDLKLDAVTHRELVVYARRHGLTVEQVLEQVLSTFLEQHPVH